MPTRLRDLNDADFDPLNQSKNKNVMRYNHSTGKFDVIPADNVLATSTSPPESFVGAVENEIDIDNVTFTGVDGGVF